MTTNVTRGEGKLYKSGNDKLLSTVNYRLHEELDEEGNQKSWWGELTITDNIRIPDGDKYVIELEDGRKGKCSLKRRINRAVILVPPRFIYLVQGTGLLE